MHAGNSKNWYSFLLSPWAIFGSLFLGVMLGKYFPLTAIRIAFVGNIYLALLQMCILPLIVTAITTSFAKLMHSKIEMHIIRRMVLIFLISLFLSAFIGLILSCFGHIGASLTEASKNRIGSLLLASDNESSMMYAASTDFLGNFVSNNIFSAFDQGRNIPVLIFAILVGIALGYVTTKAGQHTLSVFEGLFHTFLTLVNGIMYLLPVGLFTLIANEVAKTGFDMFSVMGELILYTYIIGIILVIFFMFILCKRANIGFFRSFYHLREVMVVAFVTGSSFAALPFGIASLIKDFKLSETKVNLFFPLSVCLNPVGSAYFLALVAVFMTHLYGHDLTTNGFFMIWLLAVITAVAMGSLPAVAGFALLGMLFTPLGLPSSTAIVLLIAISNILDPIVTVVNITANAMTTTLLSTPEEPLKEEVEELLS